MRDSGFITKGATSAVSGAAKPSPSEENTNGTATSGGAQPPASNPISSAGVDGSVANASS